MSKSKQVDEEEDEKMTERLNHTYKLGISSGLEQASLMVLAKAVECFEQCNDARDDEAMLLRQLSNELKQRSDDAHPRQ